MINAKMDKLCANAVSNEMILFDKTFIESWGKSYSVLFCCP